MKYVMYGIIGAAVLGYMAMSGGQKPGINLTEVLNRSVAAVDKYDRFLKQNNITKATDEHLNTLNDIFQEELNRAPPLHAVA